MPGLILDLQIKNEAPSYAKEMIVNTENCKFLPQKITHVYQPQNHVFPGIGFHLQ